MNINTANLMVGKAAGTELSRPGIMGIRVTATHTEATNGHILARVTLPEQFPPEDLPAAIKTEDAEYLEPFTIPAKPAMAIKPFKMKKYTSIPCLDGTIYVDVEKTNVNGTAIFSATDRETTINPIIEKIQDQYPDTDRVIPNFEGEDGLFHTRLNITYLETLLAIAKATGSEYVTFDGRGGEFQPVVLKTENRDGQKFLGIIMPVRA